MRRSLDRGTAGLRLTEGDVRALSRRARPNAITTGAIQACVGRDRAGARRHGGAEPRCRLGLVLSGGAATEIASYLPMPATFNENLVLDGLVAIARES